MVDAFDGAATGLKNRDQPHRQEIFKLNRDPLFIGKVRDIVGLYLDPPDRALVLCVDEKSQIQALERISPLLPMRPGHAERRAHDYLPLDISRSLYPVSITQTGTKIAGLTRRRERSELLPQCQASEAIQASGGGDLYPSEECGRMVV